MQLLRVACEGTASSGATVAELAIPLSSGPRGLPGASAEALAAAAGWGLPSLQRVHVSAARTAEPDMAGGVRRCADIERLAHGTYGVTKPTALLVRPDNYIAARVPIGELGALEEHVERFYPSSQDMASEAASEGDLPVAA